jgi:uncharacterized protein YecE (DUF72 family)
MPFHVGTAGWTLPKQHRTLFPQASAGKALSHLEQYAAGLPCVEINSSFHRPHMRRTWERWAASVPEAFRFAVKAPKTVTHTAKLANTGALLLPFFEQIGALGSKLGPVLVQLPPKLAFDEGVAQEFFTTLRELHVGPVVLEPRHESWFTPAVDRLLRGFQVARAAADPPKGSALAGRPGGWNGLQYWRLHGAPRTYYSEYSRAWLQDFADGLQDGGNAETWVIFDNTALGHATENAVWLQAELEKATPVIRSAAS